MCVFMYTYMHTQTHIHTYSGVGYAQGFTTMNESPV